MTHQIETEWLTPSEMSERSGVSIDTLRYYEREGLIVDVARSSSGHRRYGPADLEWVEILKCLRLTGMSIQQMKRFARLVQSGDQTWLDRYQLLMEHRETVVAMMDELDAALDVIDDKIATYRGLLADEGIL